MQDRRRKKYVLSGTNYQAVLTGEGVPTVPHIENVTLTANVWTTWNIPLGARNLTLQARTSHAVLVSLDATYTPYVTIKAGAALNMSEMFGQGGVGSSGITLYLMCANNTTLEILYWTDGIGYDCP